MKKINFAIALHFHQPIGNFDNIIERATQFCYKPFLELLSQYPEIKLSLHISGCLLDYIEQRHPEILVLIKSMVLREQIEILGGGYYEPILTAIPRRDIIGQIQMMTKYISEKFGRSPAGMWIAERVWEPEISSPIYEAGIRYAILDDTHLLRSGVEKARLHGYFLTGESNKKIAIFPSDKNLRYTIPFKLPQETLDYLRKEANDSGKALFVYGDDGEKFGEWPGTHKWVYQEHWLRNFFEQIMQNRDWLELVRLSDYLRDNQPSASVEIHPASYDEMLEWTEGKTWQAFLDRYPEASQMHKRMLYVSEKVELLEKSIKAADLDKLRQAKRELYKGQCNCAYWHGVFGGLYLYHLRNAVYTHLISADNILEGIVRGKEKRWLEIKEIDKGRNCILMQNQTFSVFADPKEGGVIREVDYRPLSTNVINSLSRRKEPYHKKILEAQTQDVDQGVQTIHDDKRTVSDAIKEKLIYDSYSRSSLRDTFLKKGTTIADYANCRYDKLGDFCCAQYTLVKKEEAILLERESNVLETPFRISKQLKLREKNTIEISYSIRRLAQTQLDVLFGIEFNVTMPYLNSERYFYEYDGRKASRIDEKGQALAVKKLGIRDALKECSMQFEFSAEPDFIWHFPIETVSQSERAYELNYQCSCIFPVWKLGPESAKHRQFLIRWRIL
ncbi:MAG: DUF1926 domain-containing protein [Candidatus Omnitrophica bacterium]|nr:DUF1926 domain-containing protein [Candidatus Omnitrophota bacterium]